MYEVKVSTDADKVLRKWKKSNPQLWKKGHGDRHLTQNWVSGPVPMTRPISVRLIPVFGYIFRKVPAAPHPSQGRGGRKAGAG